MADYYPYYMVYSVYASDIWGSYGPTWDINFPQQYAPFTFSTSIVLSEYGPFSSGSIFSYPAVSASVKYVEDNLGGITTPYAPVYMGYNIKTITYDLSVRMTFATVAITIFSWITDAPLLAREIQFTDVVVLYDKDTGQIRDAHYEGNMGGVKPTTQHQNEQRALHLAKEKGLNTSQLMMLHVSNSDLKPKVVYRVDLNTKQLAVLSYFPNNVRR
jgi:hypothetical protein